MNAHRYSDEEAREILQRAMESDQALERGLSQDDLIEAAAEVGISREAMTRAAEALRLERLADERLREKRQGRRRRWWGDVAHCSPEAVNAGHRPSTGARRVASVGHGGAELTSATPDCPAPDAGMI